MRKKLKFTRSETTNPFVYAAKNLGLKPSVFRERILALLDQANRLAKRESEGYRYRRVWIEPTTVKRHKRKGHYVMRAVKP